MKKKRPAPPVHPIQVVSMRTGLSADVLRAWERRYGAVTPARTESGRRLYSEEDLERLLLLRRATLAGRAIGQVAGLPTNELRSLVERDEEAAAQAPSEPVARPPAAAQTAAGPGLPYLEAALRAVEEFDPDALEATLARASVHLGAAELMDDVLSPMMRRLGQRWGEGTLRVSQEHLASALVRSLLGGLAGRHAAPADAPGMIVATPPGQRHELGAMMVAVTAAAAGWQVAYLGPDLPLEEIAVAAAGTGARAVALSIMHAGDPPGPAALVRELARMLPEGIEILVGGAAASSSAGAIEAAGARVVATLGDLRELLRDLRG